MTARQYLQLGEDPPGVRLELVNGQIAIGPSITPRHSYTDVMLSSILGDHIQRFKLGRLYGRLDIVLGKYDVRRPDIIFFAKRRVHLIGKDKVEIAPDLCVEITSPTTAAIDRRDKFAQYARGNVMHYWIVDPDARTFEGYKLSRRRYQTVGKAQGIDVISLPPFPDLKIPLGELWEPE